MMSGRSSDSASSVSRNLPGHSDQWLGLPRVNVNLTALGTSRIYTAFPIIPSPKQRAPDGVVRNGTQHSLQEPKEVSVSSPLWAKNDHGTSSTYCHEGKFRQMRSRDALIHQLTCWRSVHNVSLIARPDPFNHSNPVKNCHTIEDDPLQSLR